MDSASARNAASNAAGLWPRAASLCWGESDMYRMLIAAVAVLLAPEITMAQPASVPADDEIRQILTR